METIDKDNVVILNLRTNLINNRVSLATQSNRFQNIVASGALATMLFLVTVINFTLTSQNETKTEGRAIASTATLIDGEVSSWNKNVLKRIAQQAERKIASISSKATDVDQLRFGLLEGKYAVKMEEGKISEIVYHDSEESSERPKYINSKNDFLTQYQPLIKGDFTAASSMGEQIDNGQIVESFQLLGPESSPIAIAKFTSDQYGRLISFKVERQ